MTQDPKYLGDGVYAHDQGHQIALAANNHHNIVIYLNDTVLKALIEYAKRTQLIT